jgi:glycosyltransferase involved in cell wall biosynthesis
MKRLRVAHIITKLDIGGAELSTLYTVRNLNRTLFDPYLIAGPGGILDDEVGKMPDVALQFCSELSHEPKPLADLDGFQQLREILHEVKPHIVHTHWSKAGILGRLAASAENVPVIIHTYHGFGFHRFQPEGAYRLIVALEREASRRSHHLIFVSNENRKLAEALDLPGPCSVSMIRNGVEIEPFLKAERTENLRNEFEIWKRAKTVGMISSLRPQKDPFTFVEAATLVVRKKPNVKFLLFGAGELSDAVLKRAAKTLSSKNFLYAGPTRNPAEVLANLDLLVVPSLWEGLPRIIVEATISGTPVIASDVDGIREVLQEGRNGAFAEPQNAEDFAKKILLALKEDWEVDPRLSRQMQYEFDIRETLRQQELLYLNLASHILAKAASRK